MGTREADRTSTLKVCRQWLDQVSGAEGVRCVARFRADVESLSAAIVTRVIALERSTEQKTADPSDNLTRLHSVQRWHMLLSVLALIIAFLAIAIALQGRP